MPFFDNTSNVVITGGTFYEAGNIQIQNNHHQFAIQDYPAQAAQYALGSPEISQLSIGRDPDNVNGGRVLSGVRDFGPEDNYSVSSSAPWGVPLASAPALDYPHPTPVESFPPTDTPAHYPPHDNLVIQYRRSGAFNPHTWQRSTANEPTTTIDGGTFIRENVNNVYRSGETGTFRIHILHRAVALEAMHDSADSYPQPRCHPETRSEMLDKLWNWAIKSQWPEKGRGGHSQRRRKRVFPFSGCMDQQEPVNQLSCALLLSDSQTLGDWEEVSSSSGAMDSWKCTKAIRHDCISARSTCSTVEIPHFADGRGRSIFESNIQLPVVLIDGLDECEGHLVQQEVLRLIAQSMREHLPLKFLIASRPEPDICKIFKDSLYEGLYHPFNVEQSFEDIKKYLHHEFARIHRDHETMATVAMPWPSQRIFDQLVEKSSGYFIYASTVIKFVDDQNLRPTEQLERLQEALSSESPFSGIDQLYTQILSRVPARLPLLPILKAITFSKFRLSSVTLEKLLELKAGDVQLTLRNLHSVLNVPDGYLKILGITLRFKTSSRMPNVQASSTSAQNNSCDCPSINRADPVGFDLDELYISDLPPLAEFLPLIRRMNPIFFFQQGYYIEEYSLMVDEAFKLLKVIFVAS
ncbi:hypothetical protein B0H13DRAFT_2471148 [Mycena leptocephala]|nr:hypothetical protein B0H13DRAFT_2471148 [Mycena leptocephala]